MTEELLTAWRSAEAQTQNGDLTTAARDEAAADARRAHDRYRVRIESLDDTARELGCRRPAEDASPRMLPDTANAGPKAGVRCCSQGRA